MLNYLSEVVCLMSCSEVIRRVEISSLTKLKASLLRLTHACYKGYVNTRFTINVQRVQRHCCHYDVTLRQMLIDVARRTWSC